MTAQARGPAEPRATYRLQLSPDFTFADAADTAGRLAALGVSHLHLSPVLQAAPGSRHGYDTVDHSRVSEELGGEAGLCALAETAHRHGLGLVADVVPNHMAAPTPEYLNPRLWQVLRDGPDAAAAHWFDIDWTAHPGPADAPERGRLLWPVLGGRLGEESKHLWVERAGGPEREPVLRYHDHALPLRPGTVSLPLADLLDRQWYRLAWWRLASTELNYRRFFTVSELIALRVQDPEVFHATHTVLLRLLHDGVLDGFRVDHPDGLDDPPGYLRRLAEESGGCWTVVEKILTGPERLPDDWACAGTTGYDTLRRLDGVFLHPDGVVRLDEVYRQFLALPPLHDPDSPGGPSDPGDPEETEEPGGGDARQVWRREVGGAGWSDVSRRARHAMLHGELSAEVSRLVRVAGRLTATDERDHAGWAVRRAVVDMLASLPVYRPYPRADAPPRTEDLRNLRQPHRYARRRLAADADTAPHADTADLVRDLALAQAPGSAEFATRFAQTAAAVAAKGDEDTAYYRWSALSCRNEVGADPGQPVASPRELHAHCAHLQRHWPASGTVLTTHDTKRSADVRARMAVLAEMPDAWSAECAGWSRRASPYRDPFLLDRNTEYLCWQTLFGAWPIDAQRLTDVLLKSVREADSRTSWTARQPDFETALSDLIAGVLADEELTTRISTFVERTAHDARDNALGAALLQLCMPGVPDLYQGSEVEQRNLVDPDNRRPVDHAALARRQHALHTPLGAGASAGTSAGRGADVSPDLGTDPKLLVTSVALGLRRDRAGCFGRRSSYLPLHARGEAAEHLVGFTRGSDGAAAEVVAAATRLPCTLRARGGWRDTTVPLPAGTWTDRLTGRQLRGGAPLVDDLFAQLPVALLERR